jgi:PadR family transcriptional regulator, regulatory protein PadR
MPDTSKDLDAWRAQLRKGAAELAVLAVLGRGESYGVEILDAVRARGGLDLSEGSIYPLLSRMQKEGTITGRWVEDPEASHARKYYELTADGRAVLRKMLREWDEFVAAMNEIVNGPAVDAPVAPR